jgi:ABC-2 type transport system ATP-binding protein
MKNIIEVKNLNKFFGKKHVLNNVNFVVPKGSFVIFAGKNGSGKTTTIKCILDLYSPSKNSLITINGISSLKPIARQKIAYVPEKENFSSEKTINFLFRMGTLDNIPYNEIKVRIDKFAKIFGIEQYFKTPLDKLSSGNAKKIMIIQALLSNAVCLIMDEPTDNLDPETRISFYKVMKKIQQQNKTIFISSHNLLEVGKYADYMIIISDGKIKHYGKFKKTKELLTSYGC